MTHTRSTPGPDAAVLALLPHRPPFLLLDRLEQMDADLEKTASPPVLAHASLRVRADNPFVNADGRLEPVALAEIMAQCFAAAAGSAAQARLRAQPRLQAQTAAAAKATQGYLAALRDVRILGQATTGDLLDVSVRVTATLGQVSVVEGQVRCEDRLLAEGQCKIFVAEDEV